MEIIIWVLLIFILVGAGVVVNVIIAYEELLGAPSNIVVKLLYAISLAIPFSGLLLYVVGVLFIGMWSVLRG